MSIVVKDTATGPSAPTVVGPGGRPFDQMAQTINRGEAGWSPWILCFDPVCETARDVSRHDNGANHATPVPLLGHDHFITARLEVPAHTCDRMRW